MFQNAFKIIKINFRLLNSRTENIKLFKKLRFSLLYGMM